MEARERYRGMEGRKVGHDGIEERTTYHQKSSEALRAEFLTTTKSVISGLNWPIRGGERTSNEVKDFIQKPYLLLECLN